VERLFGRAFQRVPEDGWYQWKYSTLEGRAQGLWNQSEELVAHYAGFPRTLLWHGSPIAAIQIGDVMVAPEVRDFFTRRGPLFLVYSNFVGAWVGTSKQFALSYGFPNNRHMRLAHHLGIYDQLGSMHQLAWPARAKGLPFGWTWSAVVKEQELASVVDSVWRAMREDFTDDVIGVRDARYVVDRFLRRPDFGYRFFLLRRRLTGRAVALAVMRLERDRAELIDVVGPRDSFQWVIQAAAAEATGNGTAFLTCWASESATAIWRALGAEQIGTAAVFAVPRPAAIPDADLARAKWWWMGGDTDFL